MALNLQPHPQAGGTCLVQGGVAETGAGRSSRTNCCATTFLPERFRRYPEHVTRTRTVVGWLGFVATFRLVRPSVRFCPQEWSLTARGAGARTLWLLRGWLFLVALVWVVQDFANLPLTTRFCSKRRCSAAAWAWPSFWQGETYGLDGAARHGGWVCYSQPTR